jgi:hypothetical protein
MIPANPHKRANIPYLIRARCNMVLSFQRGPLSVVYAETAGSLLDNEVRELSSPEDFSLAQLLFAQKMLARAREKMDKEVETEPKQSKVAPAEISIDEIKQRYQAVQSKISTFPRSPAIS